jgi:hypothetical protein
MAYHQSIYHSKLYRDFKEIASHDHRQAIRFYEKHEEEIRRLDFDERFELLVAYVNALFEVGQYQKHLLMVDVVVEDSIMNNVGWYQGEDIYQKMLFRKAASCYNIMEYSRADYILRELVRIDPYNRDAIQFLKKCLRQKDASLLNTAKACSIFLFLLSALIIGVEVLAVRPFYGMYTSLVETSRNTIFLLGWAVLLGGTAINWWRAERRAEQFALDERSKKSRHLL